MISSPACRPAVEESGVRSAKAASSMVMTSFRSNSPRPTASRVSRAVIILVMLAG